MNLELIPFREFEKDEIFACVTGLIRSSGQLDDEAKTEMCAWYGDCIARMTAAAERYGLSGNIWQSWLTLLFTQCENSFSLAQERREPLGGTLSRLAFEDLDAVHYYFNFDLGKIDRELGIPFFGRVGQYVPFSIGGFLFDRAAGEVVQKLADEMRASETGEGFYNALTNFYRQNGVGMFALNKAFRWDGEAKEIHPATHTEDILLSGLIGYEKQKEILVDNTVAFLENRPANNVLLYGESGTGKSSSIKALLNEYAPYGLRMIEVFKHQIEDLNMIVDLIKNRNYKFVIFLDDLSFEQFEVEYKFLKAFIEGGLEKRPDNVLIYATSNRRHLMRESWKDREDKADDMHESETMQEKMSLVDRFGLMVRFFSPEQDEYLNIVRTLAEQYHVDIPEYELERGAIQWELRHGGFSGRCARQYIEHLAGRRK
ncbi:ATP-binding protein [Synergistaceae bacterium OttesenSCG-928-D05]|nr:ATP-binding protein [Synergistaceae bacterium OttesenSCG-928-D05]